MAKHYRYILTSVLSLLIFCSWFGKKEEKKADLQQPAMIQEEAKELEKKGDYRRSLTLWQKLNKEDPENPYYLYHLGWNYSRTKEYAKAEKYLLESLKIKPDDVDVMLALGNVYMKRGDLAKARKLFHSVLDLTPDSFSAEQALRQIGKLEDERLKKERKESIRTQMERADHFEREKDYHQALLEWKKLSLEDPHNPDYLYHIGRLYHELKQDPEAEKYLEQALALKPGDVNIQVVLGYVSFELGKMDQAKRLFKEALSHSPDLESAQEGLLLISQKERVKRHKQAAMDAPHRQKELMLRAESLEEEHEYQDALALWHRLLEDEPKNPHYLYHIGRIYAKLGEQEKAKTYLEHALSLDPQNADTEVALAHVELDLGAYDRAKALFNNVLLHYPDYEEASQGLRLLQEKKDDAVLTEQKKVLHRLNASAHEHALMEEADHLESQKAYKEALVVWKELLKEKGDDAYYLYQVGKTYHQLGEQGEAEAYLLKSLHLDPTNSVARTLLGEVYIDVKKYDQAEKEFEEVLKTDPKNSAARRGLDRLKKRTVADIEEEEALPICRLELVDAPPAMVTVSEVTEGKKKALILDKEI